MQDLHQKLLDKSEAYKSWHNLASHRFLHWAVFIGIALAVFFFIQGHITSFVADHLMIELGKTRAQTAPAPNPTLVGLADNTVKDLGPYTCTEPGVNTNCKSVIEYSGMVYDPNNHQFLIFGGGHAATDYNAINAFNPNTLTWQEKYSPSPCSIMTKANWDEPKAAWKTGPVGSYPRPLARHTEDLLVVPGTLPELVMLTGVEGNAGCSPDFLPLGTLDFVSVGKVAHYNLVTNTWSFSASDAEFNNWPGTEYDPVSGKIVILGQTGINIYDPVTKVKTIVCNAVVEFCNLSPVEMSYNGKLVYFPPNQKMYYFAGDSVFEVTLDRTNFKNSTIIKIAALPATLIGQPALDYDSANQVIGGAIFNNRFHAFNPATKTWDVKIVQGGAPGSMSLFSQTLAYDPVNNVYIFITEAGSWQTWAYRYKGGGIPGDTIPPTVSITSPASAAVVSGTITVTANASDNVGVVGVQFKLDGANLGAEDTAAPYSVSWNTTQSTNGPHTLTATARDAAGNQTTSSPVTVTVNNVATPTPTPALPSDFPTRCAAPGVLKCVGFDSAADLAGGYGDPFGIMIGNATPVIDTTAKASGAGSMKMTIPSLSAADTSGAYFTNFSNDKSVEFGQGETFYVQWRQRFTPEFINTEYAGGGGWKQAIIGLGDSQGFASSNTSLKLVTQNTDYRKFAQMYDGNNQPLAPELPGGDFLLQNAIPACTYSLVTSGNPYIPPCVGYKPNQWMTFRVRVTVGTWNQPNSHVQAWMAEEGQPSTKIIDINNQILYNSEGPTGGVEPTAKYGKIWLLPYNTGKSDTVSYPETYVWYDELIISKNPIADPAGGTPGTPKVNNLTFKVDLEKNPNVDSADFTLAILNKATGAVLHSIPLVKPVGKNIAVANIPLAAGAYDLRISSKYYLSRKVAVTLADNATITIPALLGGDLNEDNRINSLDWAVMSPQWFKAHPVADINKDNLVNSLDFSVMNRNWGKIGDN